MEKAKTGWSFCIVANNGININLKKMVDSIIHEFKNDQNYEIIIIGNTYYEFNNPKINQVPFEKNLYFKLNFNKKSLKECFSEKSLLPLFFRKGPICHKKNLASEIAKYDKLCISHDYIEILKGWREGFLKFENDWEVCQNIILDYKGKRERDWLLWDHPCLINENGISPCLIPYQYNSSYMYISGAYFCVKKNFFLNNPLDTNLFWGEGEDVEWSKRVRKKTKFKMNTLSKVKYLKEKINIPESNQEWKYNMRRYMSLTEDEKNL